VSGTAPAAAVASRSIEQANRTGDWKSVSDLYSKIEEKGSFIREKLDEQRVAQLLAPRNVLVGVHGCNVKMVICTGSE
jgi:hypothetical protein